MAEQPRVNRRSVLAGMMGGGAAAVLAGCGKNSSAKGSATSGELQVWGGVPAETGPQQMIAAFNKKYPNIKITYTRYVNDDPGNLKVDTALQGGVNIDVLVSYGLNTISKRVSSGLLVDLTDRISKDQKFAAFAPGSGTKNYVFNGKVYTIPAAATPTVVMLNKDLLQKKGITIPDGWTTDDFHQIAKEISGANTFGTFNTPDLARQTLGANDNYKNDGKSSNFANPVFGKSLQLNLDMIHDKSAMPETQILAQKLDVYPQSVFLTGKVGMLLNEVYISRYISDTKSYPHTFKTVMKPLPVPEKGKSYWNLGAYGDFLSITKKCSNVAAAWTLIDWWMKEGAQYMVQGGRLPSMPGMSVDAMTAQLLGADPGKLYDVDSVKSSVFASDIKIPFDTIATAAAEISTITTGLNQEALLGHINVSKWVSEATKQCDAAIKKDS